MYLIDASVKKIIIFWHQYLEIKVYKIQFWLAVEGYIFYMKRRKK